MPSFNILYKQSTIVYYRFGSGPQPVVCFHGYGEDASTFKFLDEPPHGRYSFLCLDLPFHGGTRWSGGLMFTSDDLLELTNLMLATSGFHVVPFHVMGFSLGGRMALGLYECVPARVKKMILLAPDGLKVNFWYWLSTQTFLGNRFFAFTMKHPRWFFGFVKLLHKAKLLNTSIFKFVNFYVHDAEARHLLYTRWTTLRKIRPHLKKIKQLIREHNSQVDIEYGIYDRIILSSVGEKFRKGIEPHCRISLIEAGHHLLREKHKAEIMEALGA